MLKIALLSIVFLAKTFNAAPQYNLVDDKKVNDTIAVIAGIMNGVTNTDNYDALKECLQNNTDIAVILDEIKDDLSSKNINGMFDGMRQIGKLVVQLPTVLEKCEPIKDDVKKFKEWASVFTKPEELYIALTKNIPQHFTEMWTDIQDAIKQYENGDFYNYGKDLGNSMVLAVGEAAERRGIIGTLDAGYQKFKNWFDHYIVDSYESTKEDAKTLGEQIADSVKNIGPFKWF